MTSEQIRLMRHALGFPNDRGRSYRNRYFTGGNGEALANWLALVNMGMAGEGECLERRRRLFFVTMAGAKEVLRPGEALDMEDFPVERAEAA